MATATEVGDRVFERLTVARTVAAAADTPVCEHGEQVVRVSRVWRLCALHRDAGLMCDECMRGHLVEHVAECDACGLRATAQQDPVTLAAKVLYPLPSGDVVVDLALHATMVVCANRRCDVVVRQSAEVLAVKARELLTLETLYAASGDAPSVN